MDWILSNLDNIVVILLAISGLFSAVAAATPSPKDDGWAKKVRKVVDFIALNVKNAKNKE